MSADGGTLYISKRVFSETVKNRKRGYRHILSKDPCPADLQYFFLETFKFIIIPMGELKTLIIRTSVGHSGVKFGPRGYL